MAIPFLGRQQNSDRARLDTQRNGSDLVATQLQQEGVGLLGADKAHPDSAKTSVEDIQLTKEWKRYRIRLKKLDLSRIKTGFVVVTTGRRPYVTFYLDSIRFIRK